MTLPERITISPDPAYAGQVVSICYDTTGCKLPVTIKVTFPPSTTPTILTITADDVPPEMPVVCFDVTIPAGSTHVIATDQTVQSQDGVCTVLP